LFGNDAFKKGDYQKAIENYTYAIECEPNNHIFRTNRAIAYATTKNWEKSLRDAEKSVEIMPSWIKGHLRRGVALFELARYQDAYNAFKQGLNFEPNNEELKKKNVGS